MRARTRSSSAAPAAAAAKTAWRFALTLSAGVVLGLLLGVSFVLLFLGADHGDGPSSHLRSSGDRSGVGVGVEYAPLAVLPGRGSSTAGAAAPGAAAPAAPAAPAGARGLGPLPLDSPLQDRAWAAHDVLAGQVATDLWLRRDFIVYILPPPSNAARDDKNLLRRLLPGLLEHPRIVLTTNKDEADIYVSIPFFTDDEVHNSLTASDWARTVVIDDTDAVFAEHICYRRQGARFRSNYLAFFKRSFVKKKASKADIPTNSKGVVDIPPGYWPYQRAYYPFSFAVEDRHLHALWGGADNPHPPAALLAHDDGSTRDVPVFSSHRPFPKTFEGGRANVTSWLEALAIEGAVVGDVDSGTRLQGGEKYWSLLKRARIVVTANPGGWEGDFRLWEALASKALVFVDRLHTPMPCPLVHGQDVVFFDPYDRRGFERLLRHYLARPDEARRVAMNGFRKALRCHRWVNRVDYIFQTAAHLLEPGFHESGLYLKEAAMRGDTGFFPQKPPQESPQARDGNGNEQADDASQGAAAPMVPAAAFAGADTAAVATTARRGQEQEATDDAIATEALYRARVAAKVQSFEEDFWAMVRARPPSVVL